MADTPDNKERDVPNAAEALHAAAAAIYFDDRSDYLPALYSVVGHLAPHLAHELVSNPRGVWEKTAAARRAPAIGAVPELPKPWQERLNEEGLYDEGGRLFGGWTAVTMARDAEIADLRAQLAAKSQGAPVYQYRQKRADAAWIECSSEHADMLRKGVGAGAFEFRMLYVESAGAQPADRGTPVYQVYYGLEGWRDIEAVQIEEHRSMGFEVRTLYAPSPTQSGAQPQGENNHE